jgi:cyclase
MLKSIRNLSGLLTGLAITLITTTTQAQSQDFEKVEITTIPVNENIYMLQGEGGNIGVAVGDDGVFLIDDQFAPLTDKITTAIAEISEQPIKFLVNTHWHFDHTGGNENLGNAGVIIVAHDQVRHRMTIDQFIEALNMQFTPSPPEALPIVTFNDQVTFHLNNETIKTIHLPSAHTDGDSIIHFQNANVIHTGDIYFNGLYPFIDNSSGGSINGVINAVNQILMLADENTKIIPGHGALSNREELLVYRDMLIAVRNKIQAQINEGLSIDEILSNNPTAEFDEKWGKGFLSPEQFIRIVYQDLTEDHNIHNEHNIHDEHNIHSDQMHN